MILCVINQKGGVGKSSTVVTLARLLSKQKPLVIDLDPQHGTSGFKIPKVTIELALPGQVPALLRGNEDRLVIIDCPASLENAKEALDVATLVIVPMSCRSQALEKTVPFLETFKEARPDLPAKVLLTMYLPNDHTGTNQEVVAAMRQGYGDILFNTIIRHSPYIDAAASHGKTVIDFAPDSLPAKQYAKVLKEIESWQ